MKIICPTCSGAGAFPRRGVEQCPDCKGRGVVRAGFAARKMRKIRKNKEREFYNKTRVRLTWTDLMGLESDK